MNIIHEIKIRIVSEKDLSDELLEEVLEGLEDMDIDFVSLIENRIEEAFGTKHHGLKVEVEE